MSKQRVEHERVGAIEYDDAEVLHFPGIPGFPAAHRIVVRAQKGSRAEPRLLPPLVLHGAAGNGFARRAEDLLNGRAALFDTE